jgi:UDP-4-amino-4,6-dideoxy-N-acetyl-beta-L-altrosamine N-acetyltransferase
MLEKYRIRSMTFSDLPMVLAWRNHSKVRRYMFTQHEISLEEHTSWFELAVEDQSRRMLIIHDQESPIGYVQFSSVKTGGIADWGFYTRPDAKKGSGQKLGIAALDHAYGVLNLHKVCGQAIVSNQTSIRFHEHLGFKREAELREHKRINDQYHTLICFGLLASEWQSDPYRKKNESN